MAVAVINVSDNSRISLLYQHKETEGANLTSQFIYIVRAGNEEEKFLTVINFNLFQFHHDSCSKIFSLTNPYNTELHTYPN